MAKLQKAFVLPLDGQFKNQKLYVLFNPAEYALEKGNQFQANALPGLSSPLVQFVNGSADSLSMELFFDTYTDGKREDVTRETKKFAQLLEIDPELHAPPPVKFVWGEFQFKAVLERINQKFTMFLENGRPVRATLTVTFKEYLTIAEQLKKVPRNSSDVTKRHTVVEDDSLWLIAAQEYRDPRAWRAIARANGISNPRRLDGEDELVLPRLPADSLSLREEA